MPDYLRILGPFHAMTGYAHMTRAVLRMALLAGFEVRAVESDHYIEYSLFVDRHIERVFKNPPVRIPIPDVQWDDVDRALTTEIPEDAPTLMIQLPHALHHRNEFVAGPRIGWTMGESDRIETEWAAGCRAVDTLWLPSRWCHKAFSGHLYLQQADLRVMPIPVDDRLFQSEGRTLEFKDAPPFLFVSVFSTTERKQWRLLMTAFAEEFGHNPDVGLIVRPTRAPEVAEMADWCRDASAWVSVQTQPLSDYDMAALYRTCDCFALVSPEGFGLPFVEAGLCGLPSIALDEGGAADVVTEETGYTVLSEMQPLIGHLPRVYPAHHRFPLAKGLDEVQFALHRAYTQRKDGLKIKAQAAVEAARRFTPESLAPRFRAEVERATERWHDCRRRLFAKPEKTDRPQWTLALGAWGDTFCSVGMALQKRDPDRPLNLLHYGTDPTISEFLREQHLFNEVRYVKPESKGQFQTAWGLLSLSRFCHSEQTQNGIRVLLNLAGLHETVCVKDVLLTQINQAENQPLCRWHDARLPAGLRCWAHTQKQVWGDYILLHPMSTQSAQAQEHWPYWKLALAWLLAETPHTYVLTGMEPIDLPESERLINLIGRTKSMMEVLALCEKARGVISTCNAVSLWTVMQRIPGLIVSNSVFNHEADYYHQWIKTEPNTVLYQYDTLEWFQATAARWLCERFAESEVAA